MVLPERLHNSNLNSTAYLAVSLRVQQHIDNTFFKLLKLGSYVAKPGTKSLVLGVQNSTRPHRSTRMPKILLLMRMCTAARLLLSRAYIAPTKLTNLGCPYCLLTRRLSDYAVNRVRQTLYYLPIELYYACSCCAHWAIESRYRQLKNACN